MFSHDATLELEYESDARAGIVAESVAREIGEIDDERSRTTLSREGSTLTIEIDARDEIALRAALNTWFSLVDVAERVVDAGDRALTAADGPSVPEDG